MDIIHLLPDSVANQIAAGEVIERPCDCVKELVENAIDAGAQNIQVVIEDAGRTLVQVIDDGKGMSQTDARMAFEHHATSKIRQAEDIYSLQTMGFRGEALPSIAAIAQVDLLTRREGDELGTHIEIAGSKVLSQQPVQTPKGTNIRVKNLYFNTPGRRRFMGAESTDMNHIMQIFYRIALVYPMVHFTLVQNGEVKHDLPIASVKKRIDDIFSRASKRPFANALVDIRQETPLVKIYGFVGLPEVAAKRPQQYFFTNGRYMDHPYFRKAVQTAFRGLLPPDLQPLYFIYFELAPDAIDVNISPHKTEIRFADEQPIWQILQAAIKEALGKFNIAPSIDFETPQMDIPVMRKGENYAQPTVPTTAGYNPFRQQVPRQPVVPQDWQTLYPQNTPSTQSAPSSLIEDISLPELFDAKEDRPTWQYHDKYVLYPEDNALIIIDQYRAHLSILYHEYRKQIRERLGMVQQVLFPDILDMEEQDMGTLHAVLPELKNVGFDIEVLSPASISVNGVPATILNHNASEVLLNLLHEIQTVGQSATEQYQHLIALSLARTAAIRAGQTLNEDQRKDLIHRFLACQTSLTPDNKRIFIRLTDNQIDKLL